MILENPQAFEVNVLQRKMNGKVIDTNKLQKLAEQLKLLERKVFSERDKEGMKELANVRLELENALSDVPNFSHKSVPLENNVVETFNDGKYLDKEIVLDNEFIDTCTSSKISGTGFYILRGHAALLELALINYSIEKALSKGFEFIIVPDMIKGELLHKTGFSPRHSQPDPIFRIQYNFSDQMEQGEQSQTNSLVLGGTSETAIAGMHQNQIIPKQVLPKKFVALSHCFRRELGKGESIYRVHQFSKVELFILSTDGGEANKDYLLDDLLVLQKDILIPLGLEGRILQMAHDELGNSACRKYDIELKFKKKHPTSDNEKDFSWGEVTSASDCGEYQASRLNIKWSERMGGPSRGFTRTYNATAMATPRVIMAILQNYGNEIPDCLKPFYIPNLKINDNNKNN
jgi:seryl-tRNA synthetase